MKWGKLKEHLPLLKIYSRRYDAITFEPSFGLGESRNTTAKGPEIYCLIRSN